MASALQKIGVTDEAQLTENNAQPSASASANASTNPYFEERKKWISRCHETFFSNLHTHKVSAAEEAHRQYLESSKSQ